MSPPGTGGPGRTDDGRTGGASRRLTVAFLAPLPPPLTGQSQCDEAVLDALQAHGHHVEVIATSKGELRQGAGTLAQLPVTVAQVTRIARAAWRARRSRFDVLYHSPSQTRIGNLKDLLLLAVLGRRRARVVLHLHGGGFRPALQGGGPLLRAANRRLLGSIGAVIVLGPRLHDQLEGVVAGRLVRDVANFAADDLFCPPDRAGAALATLPWTVTFLGSLFPSKGWPAVVEAAEQLQDAGDHRFRFVIAGEAPTPADRQAADAAGDRLANLDVVGALDASGRRELLAHTAVVVVPTSYPWEGQPLAILEGFAAGAVVVATDHAGIGDVFTGGVHGAVLPVADGAAIVAALSDLADDVPAAAAMARTNRSHAERFRRERFVAEVEAVLVDVAGTPTGDQPASSR